MGRRLGYVLVFVGLFLLFFVILPLLRAAGGRKYKSRRKGGGIDPWAFGDRRVVLHLQIPDARRRRFWFVVQPDDVSLCFTDPGYDVDVTLVSPLGVLYQVWEGVIELPAAVRNGSLLSSGAGNLVMSGVFDCDGPRRGSAGWWRRGDSNS